MKKILAITLATLMIGASLASCGGEKVCEACEETYTGKSYSITYMGQKLKVCKDCNAEFEEAKELYGQMFG